MSNNPLFDVTLTEVISIDHNGKEKSRFAVERQIKLPFAPRVGDIYQLDDGELVVNESSYNIDTGEFFVNISGQLCDDETEVAESVATAIRDGWTIAWESNRPAPPAPESATPQP